MVESEFASVAPKRNQSGMSDRPVACVLIAIFFNSAQIYGTVIARFLCISKLVIENDFAIDTLVVSSKGSRCKLDDPLVLEAGANRCPCSRCNVMRFVHDQIRTSVCQKTDSALIGRFGENSGKRNDNICALDELLGFFDVSYPSSDYGDARACDVL